MDSRGDEMSELMRGKEKHDERCIFESYMEIAKIGKIMNAAPGLARNRSGKIRRKKKHDVQPQPLLTEQAFDHPLPPP
jgi:hypothetical protein